MDILFLTTELFPWVKRGGLADVSFALPKTLRAFEHRVTIVMPKFPAMEEAVSTARRLTPLSVQVGKAQVDVTLHEGKLPSQVDIALLEWPGMLTKTPMYDDPAASLDAAIFSKAAVELAVQRASGGVPTDVIHAQDWYCALACAEARERGLRSVLTIHNAGELGVLPPNLRDDLGITEGESFLEVGVRAAHRVTTVSPNYAREIQTPEFGAGLDLVYRALPEPPLGILHGVDGSIWNPATDSRLASRYDAESHDGKAICRGALQKELGFDIDLRTPLVCFVGRLVPQKGVEALLAAIPELLRASTANFVLAGTGDAAVIDQVTQCAEAFPKRVRFLPGANEATIHSLFAGAQVSVVPSRFEPCGLVQMYAQRYGTIPVVRSVGGLVDSVLDCDPDLETGTGVRFTHDSELAGSILRALSYLEHPRYATLVRRMMRIDHGWERPARRYERLFREI